LATSTVRSEWIHTERIHIPDERLPRTAASIFPHIVDTYASETNKRASTWDMFTDADLPCRPHPRSSTVEEWPEATDQQRAKIRNLARA
jgi:hypothetical protein